LGRGAKYAVAGLVLFYIYLLFIVYLKEENGSIEESGWTGILWLSVVEWDE